MPYSNANVKGGLLYLNIAAQRNMRIAVDRPLKFQNWIIPPSVFTGMTPYMTHMNSDIFLDLQEFQPKRWLHNDSLKRFYWPFGKGTRSCSGTNLVYAEMRLTLIILKSRFELRLFETTRANMNIAHDFIEGFSRLDSKKVRVTIHKKSL